MKQNEIYIGLRVKVIDPSTCLPGRRATHIGRVTQIIRKPIWLAEVWTRHDCGGCWYTASEIIEVRPTRRWVVPRASVRVVHASGRATAWKKMKLVRHNAPNPEVGHSRHAHFHRGRAGARDNPKA